ncbi:MAG: hypothetical protein PHS97_04430 [Oscillospiraceae bacterium]|nr:hypothetical protein [Oscillospiraceae bacterium]
MSKRFKTVLRWCLFAGLLLLAMLLQTSLFALVRPFGLQMSLLPVMVACIAMRAAPESAALSSLFTGLVWCLSGADCGSLAIVTITVSGAACSMLAGQLLNRGLVTALLLSAMSLLLVDGAAALTHVYLGALPPMLLATALLPALALSLVFCPVFYFVTWACAKVGA